MKVDFGLLLGAQWTWICIDAVLFENKSRPWPWNLHYGPDLGNFFVASAPSPPPPTAIRRLGHVCPLVASYPSDLSKDNPRDARNDKNNTRWDGRTIWLRNSTIGIAWGCCAVAEEWGPFCRRSRRSCRQNNDLGTPLLGECCGPRLAIRTLLETPPHDAPGEHRRAIRLVPLHALLAQVAFADKTVIFRRVVARHLYCLVCCFGARRCLLWLNGEGAFLWRFLSGEKSALDSGEEQWVFEDASVCLLSASRSVMVCFDEAVQCSDFF